MRTAVLEAPKARRSALSNTATPKYYGQFRELVKSGKLPVCYEISQQMSRIDALIADPRYYYDPVPVEKFITYCETELVLTNGDPLKLLPTFKLWAEDIFCWFHFVERTVWDKETETFQKKLVKQRLTKKQYLIVARGAAKSLYESCIQSYFLNCDNQTTHQITTSPTMKQAEEVMMPIKTSITVARGPIFKFLTMGSMQNTTGNRALRQKLAATKKGIENFMTNSLLEIRPMSIDKLQGLRCKVATVDEWLSGDLREDVIGAIEQGASKNPDWLIVAVSSEGTVRNGAGDDIKLELRKILKGDYYAPEVSIWHYKLDRLEEVGMPHMWVKAQPNIELTVTMETYHKAVLRAEQSPAAKNDILAKRFGLPVAGQSFFFTFAETIPHRVTRGYWRMRCAMGVDLSQGDDFCAFTFLFPLRNESFGIKTRSYISEATFAKLSMSMRSKYEEFMREGSLHVFNGATLDMNLVYEDLARFIEENEYEVVTVGYDTWGAQDFIRRWTEVRGEYNLEQVAQGSRTESIPLGELKTLARLRKLIFDQLLMQFAMGNCVVQEDTNGNRKLLKERREAKIDNASALMDAYVAWKLHKEDFE
jgi:phage terminase large subunit-like protein